MICYYDHHMHMPENLLLPSALVVLKTTSLCNTMSPCHTPALVEFSVVGENGTCGWLDFYAVAHSHIFLFSQFPDNFKHFLSSYIQHVLSYPHSELRTSLTETKGRNWKRNCPDSTTSSTHLLSAPAQPALPTHCVQSNHVWNRAQSLWPSQHIPPTILPSFSSTKSLIFCSPALFSPILPSLTSSKSFSYCHKICVRICLYLLAPVSLLIFY